MVTAVAAQQATQCDRPQIRFEARWLQADDWPVYRQRVRDDDEFRFDGRVAVVAGAGRGLGRTHALLLASRGAKVVVNDLGTDVSGTRAGTGPAVAVGSSPQRAEDTAADIVASGGTAIAHHGDVSSEVDVRELIRETVATFGRVDILINNAGIQGYEPLQEMDAKPSSVSNKSTSSDRFWRLVPVQPLDHAG